MFGLAREYSITTLNYEIIILFSSEMGKYKMWTALILKIESGLMTDEWAWRLDHKTTADSNIEQDTDLE